MTSLITNISIKGILSSSAQDKGEGQMLELSTETAAKCIRASHESIERAKELCRLNML
jgi:hypothetical protein